MKLLLTIFFVLLMFIGLSAQSPEWQWVNSYGDWNTDTAEDIAVDAQGNSYTTGTLGSGMDFGGTILDNTYGTVFVAQGTGIAVDSSGNVFVHGTFTGTGTFGAITITGYSYTDLFVAKLDNSGAWQWAVPAGGTSYDYSKRIAVDSTGNAYVTGVTHNGSFGAYTLAGSWLGYIAKIDTNGTWQWATNYLGYAPNTIPDITVDSNDYIYALGTVYGNVTAGTFTFTCNHMDIFVGKLDIGGNWLGYYRSSGSAPEYSSAITTANDGSIYVSGYFYTQLGAPLFGTYTPAPYGVMTICIAKISNAGSWAWALSAGTGGSSQSSRCNSLDTDSTGNLYLTGAFDGTGTFGTASLVSAGGTDVYVASIDPNGTWRWIDNDGSNGYDYGYGIAVLDTDVTYVCGTYQNIGYFGDFTLVSEMGSYSYPDIYTGKYALGAPANPMTPANLTIHAVNDSLQISWDAVTMDTDSQPINVNRYFIYYHDTPEGEYIFLDETTDTQITIPATSSVNREFYFIKAIVD
jgi:hypothetical protein